MFTQHSLENGLVNLSLLIFILGVSSDADIDFLASKFCSEVSKAAFKGKVLSIDELKTCSIWVTLSLWQVL